MVVRFGLNTVLIASGDVFYIVDALRSPTLTAAAFACIGVAFIAADLIAAHDAASLFVNDQPFTVVFRAPD